jgi:hypothetical protein
MSPREALSFGYGKFRELSVVQQFSLILYVGLLYALFIK